METIRDSAFGKLVRLLGGEKLLSYPEEIDSTFGIKCVQPQRQAKNEAEHMPEEDPDFFGLYAVMSQASRSASRYPSASGLSDNNTHPEDAKTKPSVVVDWASPDDSEVGSYILGSCLFVEFDILTALNRILKTGQPTKSLVSVL